VELEVDGGVKLDNVRRVIEAGASVVVAGSAVFEAPEGVDAAVKKFRAALGQPRLRVSPRRQGQAPPDARR
jgi:ribulose-phosphate 3-epimerase